MRKAAEMLGVHQQTLRQWDRRGVFVPVRMPSGHRRYRLSDIEALVGQGPTVAKSCALYARVSTKKQQEMGNLARQQDRLVAYATSHGYHIALSASDVASGLNTKRRGLAKVIRAAQAGSIVTVIVEYPDRLARFGYEYLEPLFGAFGVGLVAVNTTTSPAGDDAGGELVKDLLAVVSSFAARLYGARGGRKVRQQVAASLRGAEAGG